MVLPLACGGHGEAIREGTFATIHPISRTIRKTRIFWL
jgi:hypothetical protein